MNTATTILTENQQTDRIQKGYELYINQLTEKLNDKQYLVNGHLVEILDDDIFTCSCNDFTWRCSQIIDNNEFMNCKHQIAIEFMLMNGA